MIDEATQIAMECVAATGSVELGASEICTQLGLPDEDSDQLAQEAAVILIQTAPQQLKFDFIAVCSYHLLRKVCIRGLSLNDMSMVIEAQRSIDKLLERHS